MTKAATKRWPLVENNRKQPYTKQHSEKQLKSASEQAACWGRENDVMSFIPLRFNTFSPSI